MSSSNLSNDKFYTQYFYDNIAKFKYRHNRQTQYIKCEIIKFGV